MDNKKPTDSSLHAEITYAMTSGEPLVVIEPPEGMGDATRNFSNNTRTLSIANARRTAPRSTLDVQGFELVEHDSAFRSFDDYEKIRNIYYAETQLLIANMTGASDVLAFDHNIRVDGDSEDSRKPAGIVHVDVTADSARRIVAEQIPNGEELIASSRRIVLINAWRPLINPVFSAHLALCDARTVPNSSLHKAELRYVDRSGELFYCTFDTQHRWHYFPEMNPVEVLLLKNYDSSEFVVARFAPHTAVNDSSAPQNSPARQSIEVRTIAIFD